MTHWLQRLAEQLRPSTAQVRPPSALRELLETARRARLNGDSAAVAAAYEQALTRARTSSDAEMLLVVLHHVTWLIEQARVEEAAALRDKYAPLATSDAGRAYALLISATLKRARGDSTGEQADAETALTLARSCGAVGAEAHALDRLCEGYLAEGNASYVIHLIGDGFPRFYGSGDLRLTAKLLILLGEAHLRSGQIEDGLRWLDSAHSLADQLHDPELERRAALGMAAQSFADGHYVEARKHYTRAIQLYGIGIQADQDKAVPEAAPALLNLSRILTGLREPEASLQYARLAERSAIDPALKRQAHGAIGAALRALKRDAEAVPHLEMAAQAAEGAAQVEALRDLAAAYTAQGGFQDAERVYQQALAAAEKLGTPLEIASVRRDLGLLYQERGALSSAIREWTLALALYDSNAAPAQAARLACDIGSTRKRMGQTARALKDYEQALMLLNKVDSDDMETRGVVLSNAAIAYAEQGDAESADAFFNESILLAEKLGDAAAESTRCGNYGWFLLMVGRPRRAISMLERALQLSHAAEQPLLTAIQQDNLGLAHDSLGDYPTALDYHTRALALARSAHAERWARVIQINLALTQLALGQVDEAALVIDEGLAYGRAHDDAEIIVQALIGVAKTAVARGQPADAEPPLTEAIALARRADLRRLLAEALSARSQQYAALGRSADALEAWREASKWYTLLHMPQAKLSPAWLM